MLHNKPTVIYSNNALFSVVCRLDGVGGNLAVGLPLCNLESMNASLTLWNKYKEDTNLYLLVDRQLGNLLHFGYWSDPEENSEVFHRIVQVDCNDWNAMNDTSLVCRQLARNMTTLSKNRLDEIWVWNVENVLLLQSPAMLVEKIRNQPILRTELALLHDDMDYSALVDDNDGPR